MYENIPLEDIVNGWVKEMAYIHDDWAPKQNDINNYNDESLYLGLKLGAVIQTDLIEYVLKEMVNLKI